MGCYDEIYEERKVFYLSFFVVSLFTHLYYILQEFTDNLIQAEELSEDEKGAFKEFVKEKVREAKRANREAREARRKAIEEMSEETKAAFESMKFYKFYPVQSPDTPDLSEVKSPFINRYYGKAHEVL